MKIRFCKYFNIFLVFNKVVNFVQQSFYTHAISYNWVTLKICYYNYIYYKYIIIFIEYIYIKKNNAGLLQLPRHSPSHDSFLLPGSGMEEDKSSIPSSPVYRLDSRSGSRSGTHPWEGKLWHKSGGFFDWVTSHLLPPASLTPRWEMIRILRCEG